MVGGCIVAVMVLLGLVSVVWTPFDPLQAVPEVRLQGPSALHWLGTDELGRDVLSRIMVGARFTLATCLSAVAISACVGVPLGVLAGMRRRVAERVIVGANDLLLAFPALLLAIALTAAFGAGVWVVVLALGVAGIAGFVRVARAGTLQVMTQDYILAARVNRVPGWRIAMRHVLPNLLGVLSVQVTVALAMAILAEAGLSFLGLGVPAPFASWGRMLQTAQPYLATAPHLALWPGLAIAATVFGFHLIGARK